MRSRSTLLGLFSATLILGTSYSLARPRQSTAAPPPRPAPVQQQVEVKSLGVRLEVPAGSEVTEVPRVVALVSGPNVAVTVSTPTADDARTVAAAWQEAARLRGTRLQAETLSDGWVVTFEQTGTRGTTYWVTMLRSIGGRSIRCATTARSPEGQRAAVNACKSMRASGEPG